MKENFYSDYNLKNDRIFYLLLSGMTYREIANKYYLRQYYKVSSLIRNMLKELNLQNRRQLVYYAYKKNLIDNPSKVYEY
ncbi:MAG: hypothetical protein LUH05_05550 [Candidatus Gastranaerophilales bacterium]|nr:hypothetical protein [Candidatus Gastranaerophilales bacterium]